ncbi:response regulator transcription factor [Candidatus Pristimantibacillus sp. PTI5]|uniref:response regulator transcription factor n=1 Tax=Candidatus Pristimantibacillus sp. PTI5 TaxID=3400422 RepID=UPI003B0145D5
MRILIVDDEIQTVRAIKHSIDWEMLKIDEVHTAHNIAQAKEIMSSTTTPVDIAICDIEMPQGSGLELLAWMKEHFAETECILLTCHAEFEFARKAIELGSFDYLVKPIPFEELEKVIHKAVSKISSTKRLKEYSEYGEYWIHNQSMVAESFWADLLQGQLTDNPAEIANNAKKRKVEYKTDVRYRLLLITKKRLVTKLDTWNQHLLDYALKNIAGEILFGNVNSDAIMVLNGQLLAIFPEMMDKNESKSKIKDRCMELIVACNSYLGCSLSCYIGDFVYGEHLSDLYKQLLEIDKNNVALSSKIYDLNDWGIDLDSPAAALQGLLQEWTLMLHQGQKEKLQQEIIKYLQALAAEEKLNLEVLRIVQHDVLQMVYAFLQQKEVQAHQLFKDPRSQVLYRHSTTTLDGMTHWIRYFIDKAVDYTVEIAKSQSVIGKVKEYVHANLNNEITREDIANHVFLNPDYLTRIFKKSTGVSIIEFVTEARIKKSLVLLNDPNLAISTVASEVGYDNLTYFSKLFKKVVGSTPSDYRKQSMKSE